MERVESPRERFMREATDQHLENLKKRLNDPKLKNPADVVLQIEALTPKNLESKAD